MKQLPGRDGRKRQEEHLDSFPRPPTLQYSLSPTVWLPLDAPDSLK